MKRKIKQKKFLNLKDVAELYEYSLKHLERKCRAGEVPGAFKTGNRWRFDKEELLTGWSNHSRRIDAT